MTDQLRTRFFKLFGQTSVDVAQLRNDVGALVELPQETAARIMDAVALDPGDVRDNDVWNQLLDGSSDPRLAPALRAIDFLSKAGPSERAEDLAHDAVVLLTDLADRRGRLESVIKQLKDRITPHLSRRQALIGAGPSYAGIGTTVELRAVIETDETGLGAGRVVDCVGIVSIRIDLDLGRPVFFQASEAQVRKIAQRLQSCLDELRALETLRSKKDA